MQSPPAQPANGRPGYTLLEMLLVLAVLLVVGSIVWPVLQGLYQRNQLRRDAEEVRSNVAGARLRAVDFGTTYQFRFEPGGRHYLVIPHEPSRDDSPETDSEFVESTASPKSRSISGKLTEYLIFQTIGDQTLSTQRLGEEWLSGLGESSELTSVLWSPPILFFPDGSATEASFGLIDEKQRSVVLNVRELTGSVSVSESLQEKLP